MNNQPQQTATPRTLAMSHRVAGPNAWSPHDVLAVHADDAAKLERELANVRAKADECWGAANYRLKYIGMMFRALGLSEEKMESRISEACATIAALRAERDALAAKAEGFEFALQQERNIHMTTIEARDGLVKERDRLQQLFRWRAHNPAVPLTTEENQVIDAARSSGGKEKT